MRPTTNNLLTLFLVIFGIGLAVVAFEYKSSRVPKPPPSPAWPVDEEGKPYPPVLPVKPRKLTVE